uniref:Zinc/iron transporter n=1 Tax=Papilio xuthus TaxID=66420 RepID=I4DQ93_PAPXU|nr:zinc transporter ZIP2 [Papilio xuthus]BAM20083.1 zinc/iron transporter [Papilio xuthus]
MEVSTAKAISMVALGVGSFITGMIPACFTEGARRRHPLFISTLLCFGAGVLLSTSLVHMLPEAREKLPKYSELMLCIGFFIVYFVDEMVHLFYGGMGHNHQGSRYGSGEVTSLLSHGNDGEMDRCCGDNGNQRICHVNHTPPCSRSSSGVIGLLCALFVHSLLEGLAIGLQETTSQVLLLLGAVASHKYVVGFCLGVELCASFARRLCLHLTCVLLFSGGSVVGIGLGAGMDAFSSMKDSAAVPIMQALAAGTLLYVTVSEVLPRERAAWHERRRAAGVLQLAAVAVGFALMYITTLYLDEDV